MPEKNRTSFGSCILAWPALVRASRERGDHDDVCNVGWIVDAPELVSNAQVSISSELAAARSAKVGDVVLVERRGGLQCAMFTIAVIRPPGAPGDTTMLGMSASGRLRLIMSDEGTGRRSSNIVKHLTLAIPAQ